MLREPHKCKYPWSAPARLWVFDCLDILYEPLLIAVNCAYTLCDLLLGLQDGQAIQGVTDEDQGGLREDDDEKGMRLSSKLPPARDGELSIVSIIRGFTLGTIRS